jgi:hypothetical protein
MSDDIKRTIVEAAAKFNLSPTTRLAIANRESRFDPNARNPNSSAGGVFQIIDGTWANLMAKYGKAVGVAPDATRFDVKSASLLASALAAENKVAIKTMTGKDATEGEIYAAHFLGGRQAVNLILAKDNKPDAPAAALFPAEAASNPTIFYDKEGQPRSIAQVYANLTSIDKNIPADASTAIADKPTDQPKQEAKGQDEPDLPRMKAMDVDVSPVKAAPPAPQKIGGSRAPEIESEIERVASRVGAKRGLMG